MKSPFIPSGDAWPLVPLAFAFLTSILPGQVNRAATATTGNEELVSLPEFRVETNQDNSYLATETTSGTRMAQRMIDLPYSVQSLPSEFFNDFMLFDIDEMNGFVSNTKPADWVNASATGPLSRNLFYRVDGTHYDFSRPTDFWFNRTTDLSGGLVYKFTPNTSVSLEFTWTERVTNPFVVFTRYIDRSNRTQGLVYTLSEDEYPGLGKRLTKFNQAGPYNRYERYNNSAYLTFQHRFSDGITLQPNLSHSSRHFRRFGPTSLGNWSLITNNWTGTRSAFHQRFVYSQMGAQVDAAAKYTLAGVRNESHVGFDYISFGQKMKSWQLSNPAAILAGLAPGSSLATWQKPSPFDLAFLVRAGQPTFEDSWPMIDGSTNNLYTQDLGAFYSHMIHLPGDRVVLMGTVRADHYEIKRQQPLRLLREGQSVAGSEIKWSITKDGKPPVRSGTLVPEA